MSVHVLYRTTATATGGRDGRAAIEGDSLSITMTTPRELGGSGEPGSNPEQLFAMGYAVSFLSTLKFVARPGGPGVSDMAAVTTTVGIGPRAQGGFGLDIQLDVALPGLNREEADALVQRARLACPYSNALRNNVAVRLVVV